MDPRMQAFEQICSTRKPEAADLCFGGNEGIVESAFNCIDQPEYYLPSEHVIESDTCEQESSTSKTLAKLLKEDSPAIIERYFKVLEIIRNS